jgi:glutamyl-tRNA synthetase
MNNEKIRVRFAPSPTGYLHVGGVRTALFNWLYARNKGGVLVLRIEDTDRARSTKESLDDILASLKWLGIDWDEGPFFQSQRLAIYEEYANKLIEMGFAYKGLTTPKTENDFSETEDEEEGEALPQPQGEAVIFKSTGEKVVIKDIVHGDIEFDTSLLKDFVILKSDGMPTYNFACVIDDALMNITHVIRGDDHVSNTPKQIMVYKALGFPVPLFAHVPMILGPDGARLSKRHGATSVNEYKKQGYLAPALLNFLSLLGWAPGEDRELLPINEIVKLFSLERITGRSAVFNMEKLTWMNSVYISQLSDKEIVSLCAPYLEEAGFKCEKERLLKIVPLFKKRIKLLPEIVNSTDYFFKEKIEYDKDAAAKFLSSAKAKEMLIAVKESLEAISDFTVLNIENALRGLLEKLGVSSKELMQTIRVAITGRTVSAGIFETIVGMEKNFFTRRIDQAIGIIK